MGFAVRWRWLRTVTLGLLIGPAPLPAETGDATESLEEARPPLRESLSGRTVGHSAQGRHFYVWDEDARDAADWARDLRESETETSEDSQILPLLGAAGNVVLPVWLQESDGDAGLPPLGVLLCLLPSLDRTFVVSSWATSPDEATRRALARALSAPFEAVGVRGALQYLAQDPSPEVRRLAREAAALRNTPV